MAAPIITGPTEWTPSDAETLRNTLSTPFGRRLAQALLLATPAAKPLSAGLPAEYQLGVIRGYEIFIEVINQLADLEAATQRAAVEREQPTGGSRMYPDLDDDTQWPKTNSESVPPPA